MKNICLLLLAMSFIVGSAYADWPMTAANPQRTSWVAEEVIGDFEIEWARPVEAYITERTHLIAANDKIYVASSRGLYALDAVDGSVLWTFDTEVPLGNAPTVQGSVVYVPGMDRTIYALDDADGSVLWKFQQSAAGYSANPLVIDGTVYIGCRDGYFYALNAASGQLIWRYPDFGQDPLGPIMHSPAYKDGVLYFAANDCFAYALDAADGTEAWPSPVKLPGQQYQSFWPVIYRDKVVFSTFPAYRSGLDPGCNSVRNSLGERGENYHRLEKDSIWPGSEDFEYIGPTVGISDPWTHGQTVRDGSKICEHFENNPDGDPDNHKPWRRCAVLLNLADGSEYTMDIDSDGFEDYAPIGYYGKRSNVYPPIIGINDDVYYQAGLYARTAGFGMTRGQVMGWNLGTAYLSAVGTMTAADEPQAISGGGGVVYQNLCCCREATMNRLDGGTRSLWTYSNPIYDLVDTPENNQQLPGLDVMWWGRSWLSGLHGNFGNHNGIYHDHGDQNPIVPYNGRLYVHRSNAVICYGPGQKAAQPLPILRINKKEDILPAPTKAQIKQTLETEIQKIVDAGNLNPGYYNLGQWHHDFLQTHFENPGDTLWTLCRAYDQITDPNLKNQLETYLNDQFAEYFNPTIYARKGWSEGVSREYLVYPQEVADSIPTVGKSTNTTGRVSFNYPPHNFYALYLYADLFPSRAETAYNLARSKLQVPCPGTNDWILGQYGYEINQYITGYIGFLKLQELAGMEDEHAALRSSVQNELDRLKQLKVDTYSKDSYFTTPDKTLPDGQYRGRRLNVCIDFMFMCPELADYMQQNLESRIAQAVEEYNWVGPYWFVSRYEGTVSEGATSCLYHNQPMFEAKAWILDQPYEELIKYVDCSGFKYGDLFYLNNLVTALQAHRAEPRIEPDGGGIYIDPVMVTITPAVPGQNVYYTLDGSEPNDSSTVYTGPFQLNSNTTVKAISYPENQASSIATADFYIDIAMGNTPPIADAGPDQIIQLPDDTVTLSGSFTDNTLPYPPGIVTTAWSVVDPPASVDIEHPNDLTTKAVFPAEGTYILRLTADDSELAGYDDMTVTVQPKPNEAPTVDAGPDCQIILPDDTVWLNAIITDDGKPDPPGTVSTTWTKVSGAGTVSFADPNTADTTATFSDPDTYVLRITADDGEYTDSDTLTVVVYPQMSPGAVLYLNLDENTGSTATDSSGHDNHGTIAGAGWVSGKAGTALNFDGLDDYLSVPDTWKFDTSTGTWSVWVKTDGNWGSDGNTGGDAKGSAVVMTRHLASTSREGISLIIQNSGIVQVQTKNANSTVNDVKSTATVIDDAWHHIALTFSRDVGGTIELYIDGNLEDSASNSSSWFFADQDLIVADSPDDYWEEFAGDIDDIQLYNFALSDSEIQYIFSNPGNKFVVTDNAPPAVDAGDDQLLIWPQDTAVLDADVSDDMLPDPPGTVTTIWQKISGPGSVAFVDANAVDTSAVFSRPGEYILELSADDSNMVTADTLAVAVGIEVPVSNFSFELDNSGEPNTIKTGTESRPEGFADVLAWNEPTDNTSRGVQPSDGWTGSAGDGPMHAFGKTGDWFYQVLDVNITPAYRYILRFAYAPASSNTPIEASFVYADTTDAAPGEIQDTPFYLEYASDIRKVWTPHTIDDFIPAAADPWTGKKLGIRFTVKRGINDWDGWCTVDNVTLTLVPIAGGADLYPDSYIDFRDLKQLTSQWLWSGSTAGIDEDIYPDGSVNLLDLAMLANLWLAEP